MKAQVMRRSNAMKNSSKDVLLISIGSNHFYDYDFEHSVRIAYSDAPNKEDWKDVLEIFFDDTIPSRLVEDPRILDIPMSEDQAVEIAEFVDKYSHETFIVHCDAGMSRSAAVGAYMERWYDADVEYIETGMARDQYKNIHVYNLLNRLKLKD